ncbi:MAG: heparinase II/III domain-containing protein [bacterium]|jgi:hypothetical protein
MTPAHACLQEISPAISRGIEWDTVQQKIENHQWAGEIVTGLRENVKSVRANFEHPPLGITGWYHNYFCETDAQRLRFDPHKPQEHHCPQCGKVYTGQLYDECWRSFAHNSIARAIGNAAILYRLFQDEEYLQYAKENLLWYARNYHEFEPHGDHAGKGRIMHQSLDEAVLMVTLAEAYIDLKPFLSEEERQIIAEQLLLPAAQFIHKQTRIIHNIHSWHNAAVGMVGFALENPELIDQALYGKAGLENQLKEGTLEDGFWFEGSISYHFYTISSMKPLFITATAAGHKVEPHEKFRKMFQAPIDFTFPNGEFPANNDGWPGQTIDERASYYEYASAVWDEPQFIRLLNQMYQHQPRNSIEALLYGPETIQDAQPLTRESVHFKDSGIAFLRNDTINAYLKYGPYGGGHDHNDRLNLILFGQGDIHVPDLGTSGYGIHLNRWYRSPAAHNMLVVDGQRQKACAGYLVSYTPQQVKAGVSEAYPGVDIQREVTLEQDGIRDVVQADSGEEHQYDLFFHIRGNLADCTIELNPVDEKLSGDGYSYLTDITRGTSEGDVNLTWDLRDNRGKLQLKCSSAEPYEVYIGSCPDNPASGQVSVVMFRKKGEKFDLTSEIRFGN